VIRKNVFAVKFKIKKLRLLTANFYELALGLNIKKTLQQVQSFNF